MQTQSLEVFCDIVGELNHAQYSLGRSPSFPLRGSLLHRPSWAAYFEEEQRACPSIYACLYACVYVCVCLPISAASNLLPSFSTPCRMHACRGCAITVPRSGNPGYHCRHYQHPTSRLQRLLLKPLQQLLYVACAVSRSLRAGSR